MRLQPLNTVLCFLFFTLCAYGFRSAADDKSKMMYQWIRSQIEKAGNPNPGYLASYHYLAGYVLLEKRDFKGALEHLKQANTDDVFIKLLIARARSAPGDRANAEILMKQIASYTLGSVPSSIARPEALRWLNQNKTTR